MNEKPSIGVIGGTGNLGFGLAVRLVRAGYQVRIGSRDAAKAKNAANEAAKLAKPGPGTPPPDGGANPAVAAASDIVILSVPFAAQLSTIEEIKQPAQGKILIDTTVPLVPPKVMRVQMPPEGSAGRRAQNALGPDVRVVSAFQNVSADHLQTIDHAVVGEVLVAGDDKAARETVIELAAAIGIKAWHAGALDNAAVAEALTSVLIFMNKTYGMDGAGIQLVAPDKH
jgi:NADPH-dependent F420 reductase